MELLHTASLHTNLQIDRTNRVREGLVLNEETAQTASFTLVKHTMSINICPLSLIQSKLNLKFPNAQCSSGVHLNQFVTEE